MHNSFSPRLIRRAGKISSTSGDSAWVSGLALPPMTLCRVGTSSGPLAQAIGFSNGMTQVMRLESAENWRDGDIVYEENRSEATRPAAVDLVGRVVDGMCRPIDGFTLTKHAIRSEAPKNGAINPMHRRRLATPLDVGVRAINGLIPIANGQRLGIFAGSGVGKSTLLAMMAKHTDAQKVVLALIGERSREVREFIEDNLGPQGLSKCIVVAVSAGETPLMKIRGANLACDFADEFRNQGQSTLLIMDSLTRFAMACREVGLASGEAPATKGYPPSVFSKLNALVERAGAGDETLNQGDITAFYTVLTEGDDLQDPIADNARAILDGHIVLSRTIAERGIYPPIDVPASVSRAAGAICSDAHLAMIKRYRQLLGTYNQNEDLIKAGAYMKGQDATLDLAIAKNEALLGYAQQSVSEKFNVAQSIDQLGQVLS